MIEGPVDVEAFQGVKVSVTVYTNMFGRQSRFQDIWTRLLVHFPVVLLVECTSTYYASGADLLSLVYGFEMCLVNASLSRPLKDHLTHWTFQALIRYH